MKPNVGQIVFSLNVGNAARNRPQVLTPLVVSKVGLKYFYAKRADDNTGYSETAYSNETWEEKTNYCADSHLYESEQQFIDEKEHARLVSEINAIFSNGNLTRKLTLDDLRAISKICVMR